MSDPDDTTAPIPPVPAEDPDDRAEAEQDAESDTLAPEIPLETPDADALEQHEPAGAPEDEDDYR